MSEYFDEKAKEMWEFILSLSKESDRGHALLATSYLDAELEELLRNSFVKDEDVRNKILGISNFQTRIDLAYAIGLISSEARRDLHLIRRIRNEFGHSKESIGFDHPPVKSRCNEFYHNVRGSEVSSKRKFNSAVMIVLAEIQALIRDVEPPEMAENAPVDEIKEDSKKKLKEFIRSLIK